MKIQYFTAVMITYTAALFADIIDHLKMPGEKPGMHSMRNIDFIYTINLDERPEKFASCEQQLTPYGISPYRFSAVNGWKIPLNILNDLGIKYASWMSPGIWGTCYLIENNGEPFHEVIHITGRNYFCHGMSKGAIGIVLSHLSVLQDAYDSGYDTIWVMEDDIEVIRSPLLISDLIDQLDHLAGKTGWDILFTDQDTKNQEGQYVICLSYAPRPNFTPQDPDKFASRIDMGGRFRKIGARYGTYSMIMRRSGMKKILDFIRAYGIFLPYDMEIFFPSDMVCYTVIDDVVSTQPNALSDNGAPRYDQKGAGKINDLSLHTDN